MIRQQGLSLPVCKVTVHTLRHTFATTLVKIGTDIAALSNILGHNDVLMNKNFSYIHKSNRRENVSKKFPNFCNKMIT
ncbi:MAG: tyrosine-type recombinase/integrase [Fusobacteriaceae bacterium]|nr:tyrosine-type recombinase/integrase [Fusobacteriaceae bacterium]